MHDTGKILTGVVVFLALVTFPFWFTMAESGTAPRPTLEAPNPALGPCPIEGDTPELRRLTMQHVHMDLLNHWRDEVVREGRRFYKDPQGRPQEKSLTMNCLRCHQSKEKFCDACHNYVGISPYCWDCHLGK